MAFKFENKLINDFRDIVNHPVIKKSYQNVNGKNFWNILCSAMDWIDVTANGLPEIKFKDTPFASYKTSLDLMQFVMAIDSMTESIIQLYRVIWKKDDYPLKLDNSIFTNQDLTDDKYFKHIRAAFAAHPVNLDSHDGRSKDKNDKEKWYASWSTGSIFSKDKFEVRLYSNIFKEEDEFILQLNTNQLYSYALKRYLLLSDLTETLLNEVSSHNSALLSRVIISSNYPIEQLEILIQENEDRYPFGGGYASVLYEIKDLLTIDTVIKLDEQVNDQINQYRKVLIDIIPLIKNNLQKMKIDYENYSYILRPASHSLDNQEVKEISKYKYITRKIYEYFDIPERKDKSAISDIEYMVDSGIIPSDIFKIPSKLGQKLLFNSFIYERNKKKGIFPKV